MAAAGTTKCEKCGKFVRSIGQHNRRHHPTTTNLKLSLKESIALEDKRAEAVDVLAFLQARRDYHFNALETLNRAIHTLEEESK